MELIKVGQRIKEQGLRILKNQFKVAVLLFISSIFLFPCSGQSQTWDEIFKQKETQKKYLLEQIVSLKIYASYIKKGYDIAGTGLQTIKDISNGEFNLHGSFFTSLKTINPAIRNDVRVAEIIIFQLQIRNAFKGIIESEGLSASHRDYIQSVRNKVMGECAGDLEELLLIVTSGRVEMNDDGRLERLDKIYESMRNKSAFTQGFSKMVDLLIRQKDKEIRSVNQMKHSYGID
ncbi:hypothetical protein [Daejeonella oryzae]|uniref:hypothetical protein n=1 Tax=Daejeonella oryzae TaxID=1122943 RepID=UPI000400FFB2|nr:hypothetical protein [Daejeonella oryzae]